MMKALHPRQRRAGLSLLEVLVALAIFLFALSGIGILVSTGANRAHFVQQQELAGQLCQSKIAEVVAGAVPLVSQSDVAFEDYPGWNWSLDCEPDTIAGLWNVAITTARQGANGSRFACQIRQKVLDPAQRGSTFDVVQTSSSDGSDSGASGSTDPSSSAGSQSAQTGQPASAPATKPSTPTSSPAGSQAKPPTGPTSPPPSAPPAGGSAKPSSSAPSAPAPSAPPAPAPSAPPAKPPSSSGPTKSGSSKGG